jgi:hypothetical protein
MLLSLFGSRVKQGRNRNPEFLRSAWVPRSEVPRNASTGRTTELKVRVYYLKGKPNPFEIEEAEAVQKWMLENLYDLVWEAEFKNLVTPDMVATKFRVEPNPFGIPMKKKPGHADLSLGDLIQIGPTRYLIVANGFKEM